MAERCDRAQRLAGFLLLAVSLAACGSATTEDVEASDSQQVSVAEETAAGSTEGEKVEKQTATSIPPTVNPADFAEAEFAVRLPQLAGLTEDEARDWAFESGFVDVVRTDGDYPEVLDTTGRVILEVGDDGRVVSAVAG